MLIQSFFERIVYFFLSIVMAISSTNAAMLSTENPIEALKPEEVKATFAAIADTQFAIFTPNRFPNFKSAAKDLHNNNGAFDALVLAGDITETGSVAEYQMVYDELSGLDCRYAFAVGNHDVREQSYESAVGRFTRFIDAVNGETVTDKLHYSTVVNGYKIIVIGTDNYQFEKAHISDEQLAWLESEIASENGKPVFVVGHQPLKKTHGLPDTWRASALPDDGNIGEQSDEIKAIFEKYPNVIFITGHIHTGLGQYTYEKLGNSHLVCLPSTSVTNYDGDYNESGTGFVIEIYENEVIFRARNYAKGEWVPEFDLIIPIEQTASDTMNETVYMP